jgi:hypothetical protein
MDNFKDMIRNSARQLGILTSVMGLTFAVGMGWAEAAQFETASTGTMPGEWHVVALFLLTLGILAASIFRPPEQAKVRGRPERHLTTRR